MEFRNVARKNRALSEEACVSLLISEKRGVLSVIGDGGYPYAAPINHYYDEKSGKLYFHCGRSGHRIDALKACDKVCFCLYDEGYRLPRQWALNVKSVVVFGRIRPVEDHEAALAVCRALSRKFTSDEAYVENEIANSGAGVLVLEMTIEHMTGKLVNES